MSNCPKTGKKGFIDQLAADFSLFKIITNPKPNRNRLHFPVRSYLCQFCQQWHLTSQRYKED